jgi:hypothetical protein
MKEAVIEVFSHTRRISYQGVKKYQVDKTHDLTGEPYVDPLPLLALLTFSSAYFFLSHFLSLPLLTLRLGPASDLLPGSRTDPKKSFLGSCPGVE